jgi:hypothetical protein
MKFPLLDVDAGVDTVSGFPLDRLIFTLSISIGL